MIDKQDLSLALGILSGRVDSDNLSNEQYDRLGYDMYRFSYYDRPSSDEVKAKAEDIVLQAILKEQT